MKNLIIGVLCFLVGISSISAQSWCGTVAHQQSLIENQPEKVAELQERMEQFNEDLVHWKNYDFSMKSLQNRQKTCVFLEKYCKTFGKHMFPSKIMLKHWENQKKLKKQKFYTTMTSPWLPAQGCQP